VRNPSRSVYVHVRQVACRIIKSACTCIRLERQETDPSRKVMFRCMRQSYIEAAKIAAERLTLERLR
jgi:hypothetical protein